MTPASFHIVTVLSVIVDAVAIALVLYGRGLFRLHPRRRITLPWMLFAGVVLLLFFIAKIPVLGRAGVDFFGLLRFVYLDLVIVLPVHAILLQFSRPAGDQRMTGRARVLAALVSTFLLVGIYATWIEPYRLQLEQVEVALPETRSGSASIRIGVLADIQGDRIGEYERRGVKLLLEQKPDIILIPGDVFGGFRVDAQSVLPEYKELFRTIDAPFGVFLVPGDVDQQAWLEELVEGTSVKLLLGEIAEVKVRDRTVRILGLPLFSGWNRIPGFADAPGVSDVRILLVHQPDAVLELPHNSRIDLVVAGHTHGGQVVVPFFGPPITLTRVPRAIAAGGLHELHGNRIYVSRGLGMERAQAPPMRFLCPPEVTLILLD